MPVTYKNLFTQVIEEINKRLVTNTGTSTLVANVGSSPGSFSVQASAPAVDTQGLLASLQSALANALPPQILEGLEVRATTPISSSVIISAGSGSVGASVYTLDIDTTIQIPFDALTSVFYIHVYQDYISIDKFNDYKKLTIGKIMVPMPGTTNVVQDIRDNSWNAYIVNFTEYKLYGHNGYFEEDSLDLLRSNIGPILADNLIGNIRLSENLKITNTQGTLELDSNSLKLFDTNENLLAQLNESGIFFYDTNGIELAKFATDEARVGNMLITTNSIKSNNFVTGISGFQIKDDGSSEFENVVVRGMIKSSVFQKDTISAVGGQIFVGNSTTLSADTTALDNASFTCTDAIFTIGDILVIKTSVGAEYLQVTSVGGNVYSVTRDLANAYAPNSNPTWKAGTAIVCVGNATSGAHQLGYILIDSVSSCAPFIDIIQRNSETYNDVSIKTRVGNLAGLNVAPFGQLSGYGMYSQNVYLTGAIKSSCIEGGTIVGSCIETSITGQRVVLDSTGLYGYDANGCLLTALTGAGGLKLLDPNCCDCYSYLSAGSLRFHFPHGDIPYAKRICSGSACTGETVCLQYWYQSPSIILGPKSLRAYNSSYVGCQDWCFYYDNVACYCNSASDFGWKFDVHAQLVSSGGTSTECIKNLGFGVCTDTAAGVCCAKVQLCLLMYCYGAAPANWYYGQLCYRIQYCCSGGAWACCDYLYTQAHANTTNICTACVVSQTINFGSSNTWRLMVTELSSSWIDSGFISGTQVCCLWSCSPSACSLTTKPTSASGCALCIQCTCIPFGAAPATKANIYCQCLSYYWSGGITGCGGNAGSHVNFCICDGYQDIFNCVLNGTVSLTCNTNTLGGSQGYRTCCYCSCLVLCEYICSCGNFQATGSISVGTYAHCIYNICQVVCYYTYTGGAATCCLEDFYSTCETVSSQCILDSAGCLNWLAISYA